MASNGSLTVRFALTAGGTSGTDPKDTVIEVKDISTGAVIAGATVVIDGPSYSFSGTTGTEGTVHLGVLQPGEYKIVTSATTYLSSNADNIANDRFVI